VSRRRSIGLWAAAAFLYLFMYTPIVVVTAYSFNSARYGAGWRGFTFKWYGALCHNEIVLSAAGNTLILALVSTAVATVLGTLLGFGLHRYAFPGKKVFSWLMYIPVVIPDIVMAVALVLFFRLLRDGVGFLEMGMATMIIAHITFQIPFVAIVVRARLSGMDPAIEEAAHDLGASPWQTFWHVTFPQILPGVLAGALLAFTLSWDDFVVSFFTTGPGATTLPIFIYSSVKRGITPDVNALSTLMVAVSVIGTVGMVLMQGARKEKGG
jgi:spermidine/putrescine transport system permease protein